MSRTLTEILVLLDRSGSMDTIYDGTVEGLNRFLDAQRDTPGDALLTIVQFDAPPYRDWYSEICSRVPLAAAPRLSRANYQPRGGTALVDALGTAIDQLGDRLRGMELAQRPTQVIVVIVTDGQENQSRRYAREEVFAKITHQKAAYAWKFVFLGANQDAIGEAARLGIDPNTAMTYAADNCGAKAAWESTSGLLRKARSNPTSVMSYSQSDRDAQKR